MFTQTSISQSILSIGATEGGKKTDVAVEKKPRSGVRMSLRCRYIGQLLRSILLIVATEMGKKGMSSWKVFLNGVRHSDNIPSII